MQRDAKHAPCIALGIGLILCDVQVLVHLEEQSPDIGQGVHGLGTKTLEEIGAGDQGHMFGYATDETEELMPLTHVLATRIGYKLTEVRLPLLPALTLTLQQEKQIPLHGMVPHCTNALRRRAGDYWGQNTLTEPHLHFE